MKNTKRRLLGTTEKLFYILDQIIVQHFAIAAEIEGQATLDQWQHAIKAVQDRHPNLSYRIAGNHYEEAYFEQAANCPIPITIKHLEANQDWMPELEKEMSLPFDLSIAPLVRLVLLHQNHETIVIWISNHAIGDGFSALNAIRDMLEVLSGKTLTKLPPLPSLDEIVGVPLNHVEFKKDQIKTISSATLNTGPVKVALLTLSEALTQKIVTKSKEHATSVHGLLSVALVLAGRQLSASWQTGPVRILHPVSGRKPFALGDDYNLLFSSVVTSSDPDHESFWVMAQAIVKSVATAQTTNFFTEGVKAARSLFYNGLTPSEIIEIMSQSGQHHILFSNLTQLPFPINYDGFKIRSIFGPFVLSAMPGVQMIGAITVNGQLSLTLTAQQPLPLLLEHTKKILEEICN